MESQGRALGQAKSEIVLPTPSHVSRSNCKNWGSRSTQFCKIEVQWLVTLTRLRLTRQIKWRLDLFYFLARSMDPFDKPISSRVGRVYATKTLDLDLIPDRVKPKTSKNWYLQLSCVTFSNKKGQCEASIVCDRQVACELEERKVSPLPPV